MSERTSAKPERWLLLVSIALQGYRPSQSLNNTQLQIFISSKIVIQLCKETKITVCIKVAFFENLAHLTKLMYICYITVFGESGKAERHIIGIVLVRKRNCKIFCKHSRQKLQIFKMLCLSYHCFSMQNKCLMVAVSFHSIWHHKNNNNNNMILQISSRASLALPAATC